VRNAKKFEGMLGSSFFIRSVEWAEGETHTQKIVDPTSLSRCFAMQGVRIPTRRVTQRGKKRKTKENEDELESDADSPMSEVCE
jgi:hypothetical protein